MAAQQCTYTKWRCHPVARRCSYRAAFDPYCYEPYRSRRRSSRQRATSSSVGGTNPSGSWARNCARAEVGSRTSFPAGESGGKRTAESSSNGSGVLDAGGAISDAIWAASVATSCAWSAGERRRASARTSSNGVFAVIIPFLCWSKTLVSRIPFKRARCNERSSAQ